MGEYASVISQDKSKSTPHTERFGHNSHSQTVQFIDNRPSTKSIQRLQHLANESRRDEPIVQLKRIFQFHLDQNNWKPEWGKAPKTNKKYKNMAKNEQNLVAPPVINELAGPNSPVNTDVKKNHLKVHRSKGKVVKRPNGQKVSMGNYRYVVSAKGALFIELEPEKSRNIAAQDGGSGSIKAVPENHTQFLGNQHVQTAGYLTINKKGRITKITNHSGHFKPTATQHKAAVKGLRKVKLVPKSATVETHTENNDQFKE